MRVLRSNKESVTAMLEAFVHDPLINWRLLNTTEAATEAALARTDGGGGGGGHMDGPGGHPGGRDALGGGGGGAGGGGGGDPGAMPSPPRRETREKELKEAFVNLGDANEVGGHVCVYVSGACGRQGGLVCALSHPHPCPSPRLPTVYHFLS